MKLVKLDFKKTFRDGFAKLESLNCDFVTNLLPRAFPYGISVEIFRSDFYHSKYDQLNTHIYQEHPTTYFYENVENFNVGRIEYGSGNDHGVRLTVDTLQDLDMVKNMYKANPNLFSLTIHELVDLYGEIERSNNRSLN